MINSNDLFPAAEFDDWAQTYDQSVTGSASFPFTGYADLLRSIVTLSEVQPAFSVLDLGTGTGNLVALFAKSGCGLWCTDFSKAMLNRAKIKLPDANFILHDLRQPFPAALDRTFDCIVSAYVFHHFELDEKMHILRGLTPHLQKGGRILIGDIAFTDRPALEKEKIKAGGDWEDEFYWLADESLPVIRQCGLAAEYRKISSCAGIFIIENRG